MERDRLRQRFGVRRATPGILIRNHQMDRNNPSAEKQQETNELLKAARLAAARGDKPTFVSLVGELADRPSDSSPPVPYAVYAQFPMTLLELGQYVAAERRARQGLTWWPDDFSLSNQLGVALKNLARYPEALEALARAEKASPRSLAPLVNRGNVYLAMRDGPRAVEIYRRLVRSVPKDAEYLRLLGAAYRLSGDVERALKQFVLARRLDPGSDKSWMESASLLRELGRHAEALDIVERGLEVATDKARLAIAKAQVLRAAGRPGEAREYLEALIRREPNNARAHFQLGRTLAASDREAGNAHLRQAISLAPSQMEFTAALVDSLDRTRSGDEAAHIGEAYRLALQCLESGVDLRQHSRILRSSLERCADYRAASRLGEFQVLGHYWATTDQAAGLHMQLSHVKTPSDRRVLVEQHRIWGRQVEKLAGLTPLVRKPAVRGSKRIKVGFMSSDLRNHPVSYFALPILKGYDRSRFEVFCYSWCSRTPDKAQQHIAETVDAFRCRPGIATREAAQLISDDHLDILFDLGGSTEMNKLEVMAWKPAPIQVSWLAYPHSSGLSTIDHILVDPYVKPADPALLLESPFELERSWVVLGRLGFGDWDVIEEGLPEDRAGRITFGTMNNPYKFSPALLGTWADIVRQTPGSRFLFVRPEGAVAAFRENIRNAFEQSGVERDRVDFVAVRGKHMAHYNSIDIALDTFPQTGGTTTCECLWMGVPVVTLVGDPGFLS